MNSVKDENIRILGPREIQHLTTSPCMNGRSSAVGRTGSFWGALAWYSLSLYILCVAATLASWLSRAHFGCLEDSSVDEFVDRTLYDVGFELIGEWGDSLNWVPNAWLGIGISSFVIFAAVFRKDGANDIKRWAFLHARAMWLRSFVVWVTIIPDPWGLCACPPGSEDEDQERFLRNPLSIFLEGRFWFHTIEKIWNGMFTCGDLMFSGHTIVYTLIMLYGITVVLRLDSRSAKTSVYARLAANPPVVLFALLPMIYGAVGMISLLAVRVHYTMDVVVSLYITVLLWRLEIYRIRRGDDRAELALYH